MKIVKILPVSKIKNKTLRERVKDGSVTIFEATTIHMWSEEGSSDFKKWTNLLRRSEMLRAKKILGLSNDKWELYSGRKIVDLQEIGKILKTTPVTKENFKKEGKLIKLACETKNFETGQLVGTWWYKYRKFIDAKVKNITGTCSIN